MQPCPRQQEIGGADTFVLPESGWREDGTCSYCGSLSPQMFWSAVDKGAELGPTDKNYKVYVAWPDPRAGEPWIYASSNHACPGYLHVTPENLDTLPKTRRDGTVDPYYLNHWVKIEPKSAIKHDKFYFQHFSEDDKKLFLEKLNAKTLIIGMPGHFYRLPFFIVKTHAPTTGAPDV